jgi:hypothetical protein
MASDSGTSKPKFYNYPIAREGPDKPFTLDDARNPVLRGLPLAIGALL